MPPPARFISCCLVTGSVTLMRDSVDAYGQTTVMVTHDPHAAACATRLVHLEKGLLVTEVSA